MAFRTFKSRKSRAHLYFVKQISKLQAFFRRCRIKRGLEWRKIIKVNLNAIIEAWRTRRALNCLQREIQRFVNCEKLTKKNRLRQEFHLLFSKVLSQKLYLAKNVCYLMRLQQVQEEQSYSSIKFNSISNSIAASKLANNQVVTS